MEQIEFSNYEKITESDLYETYKIENNVFIIEPNFYGQLKYLEKRYIDEYQSIIDLMINEVKEKHNVIFTGDFENPVCNKENFIYIEIEDLLTKLNLFTGYISDGSSYGD